MNTVNKADHTSFYKNPNIIPIKLKFGRLYIKFLSYIWPSKAVNFLVKLFIHPRIDRETITKTYEQPDLFPNGVKDYLMFEDQKIFTYIEREPKVLLSPGWESSAPRFRNIMEHLRHNKIGFLYFDHPGHGMSEGRNNNAVKSARLIRYILSKYPSIDTIIGHSFGGGSSFLALSTEIDPMNTPKQVNQLITVGSPTYYTSIVAPFFHFLDVPKKMEMPFLRGLSEHVQNDFTKYDLNIMKIYPGTKISVFHDMNDSTIPVSDAERVKDKFDINISKGLGHRKIMHDKEIIDQIIQKINGKIAHVH